METKFYIFIITTTLCVFLFLLSLKFSKNRNIDILLFLLASAFLVFSTYYPLFLSGWWYKLLFFLGPILFWFYCIKEEKIKEILGQ